MDVCIVLQTFWDCSWGDAEKYVPWVIESLVVNMCGVKAKGRSGSFVVIMWGRSGAAQWVIGRQPVGECRSTVGHPS